MSEHEIANRAYSTLEIKAVGDGDKRTFSGIATTPSTDLMGDIVEPLGGEYKLPIPLLWAHDSGDPIGWVTSAKATKAGIEISGEVADVPEDGPLKQRLLDAWQAIRSKLVRGLSIGFKPIEYAQIKDSYGYRYTKWKWLELSACVIAANSDASITTIKKLDTASRAASGHMRNGVVRLEMPGASGSKTKGISAQPKPKPEEGNSMTTAEQIKAFSDQRTAKAAAMDEIMKKSGESGETLDAEQSEKYDTLAGEIDTIDKHLVRLRNHEKSLAAGATPVRTVGTPEELAKGGTVSRGNGDGVIAVAKKLPPGVGFARYAGIMAAAKGSVSDAVLMAKEVFPEEKNLHELIRIHNRVNKAPVDVGTTTDSDYAAPLVYAQNLATEFIEFLRPQTIVGRIPNLRKVPFNIRVPRVTNGGSAGWVGEGAPKPVTATALDTVLLKYKKLATIAVISEELARFSSPSAELLIRDILSGAIVQQMDSDFVNPANAGTTDVKPASITNSASAIPSSGNTEADVRTDIMAVFAPFIAANITPANGVWLMSATNALALSLMVNNLGQPSFPGITMNGGTFWGMPVVVSEAVGNIVVLANASDILLADDGQVTIDTSREASLQMDSAPTNPPVAATVMISLWQMNMLGVKCERFVDWVKARAQSVQYLSGVTWGQAGS